MTDLVYILLTSAGLVAAGLGFGFGYASGRKKHEAQKQIEAVSGPQLEAVPSMRVDDRIRRLGFAVADKGAAPRVSMIGTVRFAPLDYPCPYGCRESRRRLYEAVSVTHTKDELLLAAWSQGPSVCLVCGDTHGCPTEPKLPLGYLSERLRHDGANFHDLLDALEAGKDAGFIGRSVAELGETSRILQDRLESTEALRLRLESAQATGRLGPATYDPNRVPSDVAESAQTETDPA